MLGTLFTWKSHFRKLKWLQNVDYSELHEYNVNLSRINKSLNQIAARINATGNIYEEDMNEVRGESLGEQSLKYLSFSALEQSRFIRVSEKNFGKGYTKEAIKERIVCQVERKRNMSVKKVPFPKRRNAQCTLIDTSQEKFQNSAELEDCDCQLCCRWFYRRTQHIVED